MPCYKFRANYRHCDLFSDTIVWPIVLARCVCSLVRNHSAHSQICLMFISFWWSSSFSLKFCVCIIKWMERRRRAKAKKGMTMKKIQYLYIRYEWNETDGKVRWTLSRRFALIHISHTIIKHSWAGIHTHLHTKMTPTQSFACDVYVFQTLDWFYFRFSCRTEKRTQRK